MWQFNSPKGVIRNNLGYLFIVDSGNNRVGITYDHGRVDASGGAGGMSLGQFREAVNICAGKRGVCVADTGNNRVQVFDAPLGTSENPLNPRFAVSTELGLKRPNAVAWADDPLEEKIYVADTGNNRVILVKFPADAPDAVWNTMRQHLLAGNVEGAISCFSSARADKYRQVFLSIGTNDLAKLASQMSEVKPVVIEHDTAQYQFDKVIQGQTITFPIEFVKEDGVWKILEY